jgi:hypothetical protein
MCPRFYQLRHIDRLDRGTKALRIGKETHNQLERFNKLKEEGKEHEPTPFQEDLDPTEWEVVEKLYWAYVRAYGDEAITIVQPEVQACAFFGSVKTPQANWQIWLIATLDGIIQDGDGLLLEEYKTAANLGAAQFDRFINDFQITTYLWLAKRDLGITLDGARITILPKTKYPEPARMKVFRSAYQIQEWEQTVLHECRNIIHNMERDYFPQRQTNCTKWNRACIFHDFCVTGERSNLSDLEVRKKDYADDKRNELQLLLEKGEALDGA